MHPGTPAPAAAPARPPAWRRGATWRHRGRVVQAMGLLAVGGALQKWVPMERWSGLLGEHGPVPQQWQGSAIVRLPARVDGQVEKAVAFAIQSGARRLPWKPTCLAEATAGQVMLRRRGGPGVVVIGLRPNGTPKWDAHAWLLGRRGALTGGPAAQGFTPTTVFEFPGALQAEDVDLAVPVSAAAAAAAEPLASPDLTTGPAGEPRERP